MQSALFRTRAPQGVLMSSVAAIVMVCAGSALAQPTSTTLPGGWSWQPIAGGSYDTGTVGTGRGGFDGQTNGPFNDTSFGIMDEQSTPWFDGSDQSSQQYVQAQVFGNFGTSSPPGPSGTRFFNFGGNGTNAGQNFSSTTTERRTASINNWNNAFPDAGGVAALNQVVYVPISASLIVGQGFGADEMLLLAIGGGANQTSRFQITSSINSQWTTLGFGGLSNVNNGILVGSEVTVFDPAGLGNYNVAYGFGANNAGNGLISLNNFGTVRDEGTVIGNAGQGIPQNSVGVGLSDTYNVLASLLQNGSASLFTFDASAGVSISRSFGNADARASMGPGFEGNVRLVVQYAAFQAVPTPGAAALLGLGGLMAARRRR